MDRLHNAKTVAVHDLALEQIGDGGQADMQVGPDVYLRDRPAGNSAGPLWWKNTNCPIVHRLA
jgi:hypothetical protein